MTKSQGLLGEEAKETASRTMQDDEITVLFSSPETNNPYHDLLFEGLEEQGVNPVMVSLPAFLPLTRTILRNNDIDIIHFDWLYSLYLAKGSTSSKKLDSILTYGKTFWFLVDLLIVKALGVPSVWTVHNKYHHERYYHRLEKALNIFFARYVDVLTVKCHKAEQTIKDAYRISDDSKIAVIPDGSHTEAYSNDVTKRTAREELGISDDTFTYLYFGLIRPYKGVETLLRQFRELESSDCSLWIVGNPKNEAVEERIASLAAEDDRVTTRLEFVPDEDVQYYMNAADVLVLPYEEVMNSSSAHLGLRFGKPIIAPTLGCIPETVSEENDLLYDPEDSDGLLDSLARARDIDLDAISRANRERAEYFDWSASAAQYVEQYVSLQNEEAG